MCRPAGADLFSCTNPPLRLRVRSPQGGLWQFQSWCTREFLPQWLKPVFSMPLYAGINACSTPPGIQQLWNRYSLFRASPPHHAKPRALPSHPAKTGQDGSPGVGAPGRRSLLRSHSGWQVKRGRFSRPSMAALPPMLRAEARFSPIRHTESRSEQTSGRGSQNFIEK